MEPNEDYELRSVLREWTVPGAPDWLEDRILKRAAASRPARGMMAMAVVLGALVVAAAFLAGPARPTAPPVAAEAPFIPVPYALPLDSYETGSMLRVRLPAASLIAAGYQLPALDPTAIVEADVLVGDDGRARAVRLVSGSSLEGGD